MILLDDARVLLGSVASIPGVSAAVALDQGGFVIEWAGGEGVDAEAVAAVASSLLESSARIGRELGQGAIRNVICEFDEGAMFVMDASVTTRLAVVIRDPAAMGAVRGLAMQAIAAPGHV